MTASTGQQRTHGTVRCKHLCDFRTRVQDVAGMADTFGRRGVAGDEPSPGTKASGETMAKDRTEGEMVVEAAGGPTRANGVDEHDAERFRSVAQLNMLHSLAATLNSMGTVEEIGEVITAELRTIIDYHNCRVYLLQPDGRVLLPIAFRGTLF
jgi:hypothetical protein